MLAFPCNQFGAQEPGTAEEIRKFVTDNYQIDFPMFAKIEVNGDDACDLYKWLKAEQPGDGDNADITWNFEKFLINGAGEVVARFPPMTTPEQVAEALPPNTSEPILREGPVRPSCRSACRLASHQVAHRRSLDPTAEIV